MDSKLRKERSGLAWLRMGSWRLRGLRQGQDGEICLLCRQMVNAIQMFRNKVMDVAIPECHMAQN
jgi:hypothetical protein